MTKRTSTSRILSTLCGVLLLLDAPPFLLAEPTPAAVAAFDAYTRAVELRLAAQHRLPGRFLALGTAGDEESRLRRGELVIEPLTPADATLSGALLHHWRGTAFAAGAHPADFERLMRDFNSYPQHFAPEVVQARTLSQTGDRFSATMRVRQHHVLTVVMDTTYDVGFTTVDSRHGYSISRSTHIDELDSAGRPLSAADEHGFLWRLNTYWSYEERDGGLYLQIEAVSLTRSIPAGLGWAVRPYVDSIPRESLAFTLTSARNALRK
jgi:hypothetical protein